MLRRQLLECIEHRIDERPERDRVRLSDTDLVEDDRVALVHAHDFWKVGDERFVRRVVVTVDENRECLRRVFLPAAACRDQNRGGGQQDHD